jgi:hypothetical protein
MIKIAAVFLIAFNPNDLLGENHIVEKQCFFYFTAFINVQVQFDNPALTNKY